MNIFDYIDRSALYMSIPIDGVHIEKGTVFNLSDIQHSSILVKKLKNFGNDISFSISFKGKVILRIGVSRPSHSSTWIYEKKLESTSWHEHCVLLDLARFEDGSLEICFLGVEDSAILPSALEKAYPSIIPSENILYSFLSPTYEICSEEALYYKFTGAIAYYSFEEQCVFLGKDASVDLMTYFNSFSSCKWNTYTNVRQLSAYVDIVGEADIYIAHKDDSGQRALAVFSILSAERATFELPIGSYPKTGILGLRIKAHEESILYGGGWLSPDPEVQQVHLGIGITTFKREDAVKTAVARLRKAIAEHPQYNSSIDITVVDNGQTLSAADLPGVNLIPSKNLGGTGGFTRSLIHYQDAGIYTHCLFMDDDASCEAGAIFRSISFIRHTADHRTAISGAMLYENLPYLQWENGAWFDGCCRSLKRDFDMRDAEQLIKNESEVGTQIYGAWWFFLFPVAEAKCYPFPFFVRGDDVDFSYINNFNVITLNGVSCWQVDFKTKDAPFVEYLNIRNNAILSLSNKKLNNFHFGSALKIFKSFYRANNSYMYDTASCITIALQHIIKGPEFIENNMEHCFIRDEIKKISTFERFYPLDKKSHHFKFGDKIYLSKRHPIINRIITFNGHIFPDYIMKNDDTAIEIHDKYRQKYSYKRIRYYIIDAIGNRYMPLERSIKRYFKNFYIFMKAFLLFVVKYNRIKKLYSDQAKNMRTREFWEKQFKGEGNGNA